MPPKVKHRRKRGADPFKGLSRTTKWRYLKSHQFVNNFSDDLQYLRQSTKCDQQHKTIGKSKPKESLPECQVDKPSTSGISSFVQESRHSSHQAAKDIINSSDSENSLSSPTEDFFATQSDTETDSDFSGTPICDNISFSENECNQSTNSGVSEDELESDEDDDCQNHDFSTGPNKGIKYKKRTHQALEDIPLYCGANISVLESASLLLQYSLRHSLSNEAIGDLLKVVKLHCPKENACVDTLYKFRKIFSSPNDSEVRHYYCSNCVNILDKDSQICNNCEADVRKFPQKSYFLEFSCQNQLQSFMKRPGFYNQIDNSLKKQRINGIYRDIQDGHQYKTHPMIQNYQHPTISLSWYTDGVRLFKSSKVSMWPIYLAINELDLSVRYKRENILYPGIWVGCKPEMNVYFKVLDKFLNTMQNGVSFSTPDAVENVLLKGFLLCGTCDLPARAAVLNMTQFNGRFGCCYCKHPGISHKTSGKGSVQVYNFTDEPPDLRCHNEVMQQAVEAFESGKPVFGIKGPTRLAVFLKDIVMSTGVDIMHSVYLGVTSKLMELWFDSEYGSEKFSIHQYIDVVDNLYMQIKPPNYIQRAPRSIKATLGLWKATEFRNWLLYYSSPVLVGILEKSVFRHHMLLVSAIHLLSKEVVMEHDIDLADKALVEYVKKFESIYSRRHMSANVHLLLHLALSVRNLGPLSVLNAFPFETLNGQMVKSVHGTQHCDLQVKNTIRTIINSELILADLDPTSDICLFIDSLISPQKNVKVLEQISNNLTAVGTYLKVDLPLRIKTLIVGILPETCIFQMKVFNRIKKDGMIICSQYYTLSQRRISNTVKYNCMGETRFGNVVCFVKCVPSIPNANCQHICETKFFVIIEKITNRSEDLFNSGPPLYIGVPHIALAIVTDEYDVVDISCLQELCLNISFDDKMYIVLPPNKTEF